MPLIPETPETEDLASQYSRGSIYGGDKYRLMTLPEALKSEPNLDLQKDYDNPNRRILTSDVAETSRIQNYLRRVLGKKNFWPQFYGIYGEPHTKYNVAGAYSPYHNEVSLPSSTLSSLAESYDNQATIAHELTHYAQAPRNRFDRTQADANDDNYLSADGYSKQFMEERNPWRGAMFAETPLNADENWREKMASTIGMRYHDYVQQNDLIKQALSADPTGSVGRRLPMFFGTQNETGRPDYMMDLETGEPEKQFPFIGQK